MLATPFWTSPENTGFKITTRVSVSENTHENVVYLQSDRRRMEYQNSYSHAKNADGTPTDVQSGPRMATITRCDLGQAFQLDLDFGEYSAAAYPPQPLMRAQMEARGLKAPVTRSEGENPTLRVVTTFHDTRERRDMFGHTAWNVVWTIKEIPLEGSHSLPSETVVDTWYIDLNERLSCDRKGTEGKQTIARLAFSFHGQPQEKVEYVTIGEAKTGFPVQTTVTSKSTYALPDGTKKENTFTTEMEVTALEEVPLDPALFEIPSDFRQVERLDMGVKRVVAEKDQDKAWEEFKTKVESILKNRSPQP
jgi:hypothetical protein